MNFRVFPRLSTSSRRSFIRLRGKFGRPYDYRPRGQLIQRLATELSLTPEEVLEQIYKERAELTRDL